MDADLRSIQQARDLLRAAAAAQHAFKTAEQATVDRIVAAMCEAGAAAAERLGRLAHEETGFGRPESKTQKNLFATRTLAERMQGMKTAGIVRKNDAGTIWEVATPMGVVAALVPSTNPTSTAMYKAIIAAKARCGIVMSPHPRATACTAEALRVVAEAAYSAGAPEGLFGCMTEVSLHGTNALLEDERTDVILATGGGAMVRAAYSKGKPAYGVGSGNVPAYVDRSATVEKAAADLLTGTAFDWGTLCSTERSVVADAPIRARLLDALRQHGAHVCTADEAEKLRQIITPGGVFNVGIVGQSPARIAQMAGFAVSEGTKALVAEVTEVGPAEPLSMETLSPILSFYAADGWEAGCERCITILEFGGIGHTLAVHAQSERVIEQFALKKPSMRIVVNTVAALGSVGMTTDLFPAMTLGPGTVGGSITSDNISPLHLLNIKRVAFETAPLNTAQGGPAPQASAPSPAGAPAGDGSWMDTIEARLRDRAGNAPVQPRAATSSADPAPTASTLPLPDGEIASLIRRFRK
ncbi:MAG: aldehyde dehydrogenase family protein [Rhodothermaceae bacterium]|nr:aldehyde dehydrogenase family protein [Rhodothermaceae bacterium]